MNALLPTLGLLFCFSTPCEALRRFPPPNRVDNSRELTPVIKHCSEDYFYKEVSIINAREDLSREFYRRLNEELGVSVRVWAGLERLNSVGFHSCVILCLPIKRISYFLASVDQYSWIPNNVYVIYTPDGFLMEKSKQASFEHEWSSAAARLWERSSVHKLILSMNGRSLLFDPFEPSPAPKNTTNLPENIFGVPKELGDSTESLKRRNTFQGYETNVALFPYVTAKQDANGTWSGLQANAMSEICKRMNITPQVFSPPEQFGWFDKGRFHGTLGRLVYHESKLAFNAFFVKDYGTKKLEFTSYLNSDKICVMVPQRPRLPEYLLIVRIFGLESWGLILIGNGFVALVHVPMTNVRFGLRRKEPKMFYPKFSTPLTRVQRLLGTWIFLCLYPARATPECHGQRLHIACGLMLGIVVGGCFTSQLASSFSKPTFLKNIDTLEELDASGLQILTSFPNLLYDVFTHDDSSTRSNLQTKLQLKNASEIETQVLLKRNAGYLDRKDAVTLNKNPKKGLHVLAEYPREYHLAYPIPKGSPFLERINTIIGRLQSGGLYDKWFEDMANPVEKDETQRPVVIRLPHLYIPFLILLTGLGIAGGVFYSESKSEKQVQKANIVKTEDPRVAQSPRNIFNRLISKA